MNELDRAARGCADFGLRLHRRLGGITDDPAGLDVTSVVHQANITVDARGTEAAAATGVMAAPGVAFRQPLTLHPFIVERSFFFAIRDESTRTVLFAGRVIEPSRT